MADPVLLAYFKTLRGIVNDLARIQPERSERDLWCWFCGADENEPHEAGCVWGRARAALDTAPNEEPYYDDDMVQAEEAYDRWWPGP